MMTYPYNDDNRSTNNNAMIPSGGWQQPGQPVDTQWEGSTYRSATRQVPVPPMAYPPPKPRKPRKLALKIAAAVMACLVVSAGSIGAYSALVKNGILQGPTDNASSNGDSGTNGTSSGNSTNKGDLLKPVANTGEELTLQEIAKKVIPSVVCIQNYQYSQSQGGFGYGYGQSGNKGTLREAGEGSGIIATSDGYIITNAHVVDGADALKVVLHDGTTYDAKLIGSDTLSDLALLKIEASDLTAAEFGDSGALEVAEQVMAVGNPGGMSFQSSVTIGYISGLNRQVTSEDGTTMNFIQTDAAINPGNSGGALVNMYGQVIGINTAKISNTNYEGLGFAIPISDARSIINSLKENGKVQRPALGITGAFIDETEAVYYNMAPGMYVQSVTNTVLAQAGLKQGDVITAINETKVTASGTISSVIKDMQPGDTVTLEVSRKGETFTISAPLVESSAD